MSSRGITTRPWARPFLAGPAARAGRELGLSSGDAAELAQTAIAMTRRLYQLGFVVRKKAATRSKAR